MRDVGKLFHVRAAATGKARSPVERRVGGTTSDDITDIDPLKRYFLLHSAACNHLVKLVTSVATDRYNAFTAISSLI